MKNANKISVLGILFITLLFGLAPLANATPTPTVITTYTYTGNPFTNFAGNYACPPQCGVTGFFTVAGPPPVNLVGSDQQFQFDVTPLTFSFTDGNVTATNITSCADFFSISTTSTGQIDAWTIRLFTPPNDPCAVGGPPTGVQLLTGNVIDITIQTPEAINFAATPQNPGTWSMTVTPEPNTFVLFATGLVVLFLATKGKI